MGPELIPLPIVKSFPVQSSLKIKKLQFMYRHQAIKHKHSILFSSEGNGWDFFWFVLNNAV